MRQVAPRAVARRAEMSAQEFVGLCSTALWGLAAIFLLATFQVY